MINLRLPVKDVFVTQPFGRNYVDFYQKLGLKGHNGVDFRTRRGCPVYATHYGWVSYAGQDGTGGIGVYLIDKVNHFQTVYYHLLETKVNIGEKVQAGQLIGLADNTGLYTTGDHLHFGLKELDENNFNTKNYDNGYKGSIDPAPYFHYAYDGTPIGNKDWDKSRSYHRYYRGRPKGGYQNELKVIPYMIRRLKRLPTNEEINAAVYGSWSIEDIMNEAMYENWSQLRRGEFMDKNERPFQ